ncbi:MAG: 2-oxoacid:ferredoxin oxidoreductase subunit beta [Candidatus Abyssobacteria bacterium SURF_5]|uniref:2-oxoacid:ferredoxin oxidoreductase subunit beta n=1 Tax=Abyssobacteria bacterium (strain SURF_5) TaxID=2093360 RepID=A0A3A4NV12_ABYX5|nr:MAG: 2-oxoacid:ferredoxin oxidoreductase subunit beta [Candidatus Abyssubacteria bacterium SURF_5]
MSDGSVKQFKKEVKPVWCPGCGNYGVLSAVFQAFGRLDVPREDIVLVSGIGCSSRLPGYVNVYGFNSVHGRSLPIATGVKLAKPELTVVAVGGDGDALSIGGGHIPHIARRNVDITFLIMDNSIYALTKGQASPTTPFDDITTTSTYGTIDEPLDAVSLALAYGVSFVARGHSADVKHLASLIVEGIHHPGFALIHIISPCITWRGMKGYDEIKERTYYLDERHDPADKAQAVAVSLEKERLPLGIIYRERRPTYWERILGQREDAKSRGVPSIETLLNQFVP